MFYLLIVFLAAAGGAVYFFFFMQSVPGAVEERFGALEPLPSNLGEWQVDADSPEAAAAQRDGLKRETRYFFEEGKQRLLKQARYRNAEDEIVRVEPDQVVKRRRLKH
ncbi:MAG: hypothetical protein QM756_45385 [Polyangiaceae bacterium]